MKLTVAVGNIAHTPNVEDLIGGEGTGYDVAQATIEPGSHLTGSLT
jgi:hypothetical protein